MIAASVWSLLIPAAGGFILGIACLITGNIRVNDTSITTGTRGVSDVSSWSGSYFVGTTQTFTAVPLDGYTFVKLIVTDAADGTSTEYTDSSIEVTFGSGGTVVQAVFE